MSRGRGRDFPKQLPPVNGGTHSVQGRRTQCLPAPGLHRGLSQLCSPPLGKGQAAQAHWQHRQRLSRAVSPSLLACSRQQGKSLGAAPCPGPCPRLEELCLAHSDSVPAGCQCLRPLLCQRHTWVTAGMGYPLPPNPAAVTSSHMPGPSLQHARLRHNLGATELESRAPTPAPWLQARGTVTGSVGSSLFHSRADESLDKNAAQF